MVGPLPADKIEGLTAVQEVNQLKPEILLLQCPIEKEDVRSVVFDDQKVVIYFTQVASFSPYRLWSDPLLPRHI